MGIQKHAFIVSPNEWRVEIGQGSSPVGKLLPKDTFSKGSGFGLIKDKLYQTELQIVKHTPSHALILDNASLFDIEEKTNRVSLYAPVYNGIQFGFCFAQYSHNKEEKPDNGVDDIKNKIDKIFQKSIS